MIELVVVVTNGALGVVVVDRLTCVPSFMVFLVCLMSQVPGTAARGTDSEQTIHILPVFKSRVLMTTGDQAIDDDNDEKI